MFDAVIFDFDGVIVDSERYHFQSIIRALAPHEVDLNFEGFRHGYTGGNDRDTITRICQDFGIPFDGPQIDHWRAAKANIYPSIIKEGIQALPGAVDLIKSAADEMPIGLATGSRRSDIEAALPHLESGRLRNVFEITVTSDDVDHPKPAPDTYAAAAEGLGLSPAQCIAIEDTPAGIRSAQIAGLRVLGVAGTHAQAKLEAAEHIVPSLDGMSIDHLRSWF